jgi:hypothetical protein
MILQEISFSSFSSLLVSKLGFTAKKKFKQLLSVLASGNYLYCYFLTLIITFKDGGQGGVEMPCQSGDPESDRNRSTAA